uniref:Cytosolic carboxypeptidase N-terminal domain-containing protein n=1 Tax=Sinocyclocheilus rhinocerous TaxID=307959 RepID=A0A673MR72_9TELE
MSEVSNNETGGEDALVGNVNKLMVTPPGYTGPPKKGHIVFDACFESGNLGRVDYISEFEFDLFIRPDTCNPRFRVWFNFTVENVRETQVSQDLHRDSLQKITHLRCSYHFSGLDKDVSMFQNENLPSTTCNQKRAFALKGK